MFIRPPLFSSTRLGSPFPLRFASACALVFTQFRASHRRFIRLFPRPQRRNFARRNFAGSFTFNLTATFNLTTEARRHGGVRPFSVRPLCAFVASVVLRSGFQVTRSADVSTL